MPIQIVFTLPDNNAARAKATLDFFRTTLQDATAADQILDPTLGISAEFISLGKVVRWEVREAEGE